MRMHPFIVTAVTIMVTIWQGFHVFRTAKLCGAVEAAATAPGEQLGTVGLP